MLQPIDKCHYITTDAKIQKNNNNNGHLLFFLLFIIFHVLALVDYKSWVTKNNA